MPVADVNGPPLMLYRAPLLMLIDPGDVMLVTVIGLEICVLEILAPVTGVNPACGICWVAVVTVYVDVTPPMVATAEAVVLYVGGAIICTVTWSPGWTVPGAEVNGPPLMLYSSPLLTLIGAGIVVPVTVMALDVWTLPATAPVTGVKPP